MSVVAWILIGLVVGYVSSRFAGRQTEAIFQMSLAVLRCPRRWHSLPCRHTKRHTRLELVDSSNCAGGGGIDRCDLPHRAGDFNGFLVPNREFPLPASGVIPFLRVD